MKTLFPPYEERESKREEGERERERERKEAMIFFFALSIRCVLNGENKSAQCRFIYTEETCLRSLEMFDECTTVGHAMYSTE